MKKINYINRLVNNIQHSERVYHAAGKSVHAQVIKNELLDIEQQRNNYFHQLKQMINKADRFNKKTPMAGNLTTRIWLKINDLLIHRNVPNILKTCVKKDQQLLKIYQKSTQYALDDKLMKLIDQQRLEISMQNKDFEKRIKSYPWI